MPVTRRGVLAAAGGSALLLAGRPARAQTLAPVRVGAGIDDGLTPLLYAQQSGLFRRAGLDVQIQATGDGASLAAAVAGGAIDIAKSALMSLITAYARGLRFKLVAGAALYQTVAPTTLLCVMKSSTIASLADVDGKTIAVSTARGLDTLGTQASIDRAGGHAATVKFVEMPFAAMFPALQAGRVDMASIATPHLAEALASGNVRTFGDPYDGIGKHFLIAAWFATADYLDRNAAVARRFAAAMADANAYANAHHAETAPILAQYSHIDPAVILKMNRLDNATVLDPSDVQLPIDAAARYHFIDAPFPAKELLWP